MKQGALCLSVLLFSFGSFADPIVSVISSCPDASCVGGVQTGSVVTKGVPSLDVYASVTGVDGPSQPPNVPLEPGAAFTISTVATVYIGGSGAGAIVVDPILSSVSATPGPGANTGTEPSVAWQVNGLGGSTPFCDSRPFAPGCMDEQLIPITLGTTVTVIVGEANKFESDGLPPGTTQTLDLNLWAVSANGDVLPVTLAEDAPVPEPEGFAFVGFGLICFLVLQRHRSSVNANTGD